MKKLLSTLIIIGAIHTNEIASQDVEETIVVTSALIDTTEITNPLYVIDGDEIIDDATTSLGDAIDSYLGVSIADYGAAVGQPIIRGMSGPRVKILKNAENAQNFSQCDSILIGDKCGAHTFPYIDVNNPTAKMEHEATTSSIGEDQLFYCNQRGIKLDDAVSMIVNGFCKEVFEELPMEFAVEAKQLIEVTLENSVG